ncbi:50S ribosomal protein L19e [Candidatus Woesearchaeota archaeon]|nr:50S ribosomal protein L19e [Candidatus Woesearchaeota archaeon]
MDLTTQKALAAKILKVSPKRVRFDTARLDEIKEAITKHDLKLLMSNNAIIALPIRGTSRVRARKRQMQEKKGRRRGHGKRKGTFNARLPRKLVWMAHIRLQRALLKTLRDGNRITHEAYHDLYQKAKGGFFRSQRHLKLYLEEHKLVAPKNNERK